MKRLYFLLILILLCHLSAAGATAQAPGSETMFTMDDFEVLCSAQDENGNLCIGGRTKMPKGRLICVDTTGNLLWSVENDLPGGDWYSSIVPCGDGRYMALHQQNDSTFTHHLEMIEQGQVVKTTHLPDEQAFSLYPAEDGVLLLTGTAIDATSLSKWSYDGKQLWKLDFGKGYRFDEMFTLEEGYLGIGYHIPNQNSAGDAAVCLIGKEGEFMREYFSEKDSRWIDAAIVDQTLFLCGREETLEAFQSMVASCTSVEELHQNRYTPRKDRDFITFALHPWEDGFLTANQLFNKQPGRMVLLQYSRDCTLIRMWEQICEEIQNFWYCQLYQQNNQVLAVVCGSDNNIKIKKMQVIRVTPPQENAE